MTGGGDAESTQPQPAKAPEPEWQRKARLARIFGDVLPETTRDERDDNDRPQSSDDWLKAQVPPHHGG